MSIQSWQAFLAAQGLDANLNKVGLTGTYPYPLRPDLPAGEDDEVSLGDLADESDDDDEPDDDVDDVLQTILDGLSREEFTGHRGFLAEPVPPLPPTLKPIAFPPKLDKVNKDLMDIEAGMNELFEALGITNPMSPTKSLTKTATSFLPVPTPIPAPAPALDPALALVKGAMPGELGVFTGGYYRGYLFVVCPRTGSSSENPEHSVYPDILLLGYPGNGKLPGHTVFDFGMLGKSAMQARLLTLGEKVEYSSEFGFVLK